MVLVRHVIYAEIFTGHASRRFGCILWPDLHDELPLSQLIGDVWREQRAVRVEENMRTENRLTPTELPLPEEARQASRQDPHLPTIFITNKSDV